MNVVILAAGYSIRLYPLTRDTAKPLIRVGSKTILDRIMDHVGKLTDVSQILIVVNAKFHRQFDDWLARFRPAHPGSARISLLNDGTLSNETRLGAVGDIALAVDRMGCGEDMLIVAGDNLFAGDLPGLCRKGGAKGGSILGIHEFDSPDDVRGKFGVVLVNPEGRVESFLEKPEHPTSALAATAIYFIRSSALPLIPSLQREPHDKEQNSGEMIKYFLEKGEPVFSHNFPVWYDIGGPEDLEKAVAYCTSQEMDSNSRGGG